MESRADRLKRLIRLQKQIKGLHETRHAQHLTEAARARQDATELLEALNRASPLPGLFPDIYNRRIGAAVDREEQEVLKAQQEAHLVAKATARTKFVEQAWREAAQLEERAEEEKAQLEILERKFTASK
ncbi:hypothetical protein [Aquamicrobium zhengzhouense]|uniref:Flagellar export protein FliJ n=1 Tax=Aquamicrobium zhengzhouense TaxID=2781738 RepID=A0ABS0S8U4_9HYPH|nr:hypothetical protein [Aquamicrobium zhengzhouense]MBI1619723.1 hypothetical protein [Aquamicrobium zhengzhouense]